MNLFIAIPVKSFDSAKARLTGALTPNQRRELGRAVAERTLRAASGTGADVAIVTTDPDIGVWAVAGGAEWVKEADGTGSGLDRAAAAAVAAAAGRRWMVVHADLPLVRASDLERAAAAIPPGGYVLSPSYDGGTALIGGTAADFRFCYGPGSFHRHLGRVASETHRVHFATRLALDIDGPHDLATLRGLGDGAWLDTLF